MDLNDYRKQINEVDAKIVKLFEERMEISKSIAAYKKANNLPTRDPKREEEVLQKHSAEVKPELSIYCYEFFEKLMQLSRDYQNSVR
ncbi:MAG: chorismate mutase [Bacillota bacterium]|nr:chorismate mutase [Bacillota bacterium]